MNAAGWTRSQNCRSTTHSRGPSTWARPWGNSAGTRLASFVSPSRALTCALDIQRAFAAHNATYSENPIRVRIGLSAGEPVAENDDLFGAAVQLAARACAYAQPEQVVAANVVRELCIGKNFAFVDQGEVALKGFEEPQRLFAVTMRG